MIETDTTKFKSNWYKNNVLTEQEVKKLIAEKLERAKMYHLAEKQREALIAESRLYRNV